MVSTGFHRSKVGRAGGDAPASPRLAPINLKGFDVHDHREQLRSRGAGKSEQPSSSYLYACVFRTPEPPRKVLTCP